METKSLLFGIGGLLLGGLIVSVAATFEPPKTAMTHDTSMTQMTDTLKGKTGDDYDKTFLQQMIAHHQAAVDMAKVAQTNAKHSEIKQLSSDIIAAQEKEINKMRQWQTQWGY